MEERHEEMFDTLDEEGNVTGRERRSRCHSDPSLIHGAVHVFVTDGEGRIFLQKRSLAKDIQPGRWDTSVGGHLSPGESYEEGAAREMLEEVGLRGELRFLHRYLWRTDRETELVQTYIMETGETPVTDPEEIDEGRFFSRQELERLLEGDNVTPNLREELRRLGETGIPSATSTEAPGTNRT